MSGGASAAREASGSMAPAVFGRRLHGANELAIARSPSVERRASNARAADPFSFTVTHRDGAARRGELRTPHGVVQTPAFMPVGTRGAVKAVTHRDLEDLGAEIILGNTYHLYLRPGDDLIARAGGLHRFIGWTAPILTDSGGYQVFSLARSPAHHGRGREFRSHLDGSLHLLTPESATDIQAQLGSDIAMVLDECIATPATPDGGARARWSARSAGRGGRATRWLAAAATIPARAGVTVTNPGQAQFGIIQGGTHPGLRTESVAGDASRSASRPTRSAG